MTHLESASLAPAIAVGDPIRFFSMCGPCIPAVAVKINRVTIQTNGFGKIAKNLCHTTPCPSCTDHAHTQYPNGYMD